MFDKRVILHSVTCERLVRYLCVLVFILGTDIEKSDLGIANEEEISNFLQS